MTGRMELHPEFLFQHAQVASGASNAGDGLIIGTFERNGEGTRPVNEDFPNPAEGTAGVRSEKLTTLEDDEVANHNIGAILFVMTTPAGVTGTLSLDESTDGNTWTQVPESRAKRIALAANETKWGSILARNTQRHLRLVFDGSAATAVRGAAFATREG